MAIKLAYTTFGFLAWNFLHVTWCGSPVSGRNGWSLEHAAFNGQRRYSV